MVRKEGQAKFRGLKMKTKLENQQVREHSKKNGIAAMHHFCFEKWLDKKSECCHILCFCPWCVSKLDTTIVEERCGGPRNDCKL